MQKDVIYVCCRDNDMVGHTLWKKIGSRWHVYFGGQEWIRSTMDASTKRKLKKL